MEFFLTSALIAVFAAALSAGFSVPNGRLQKPYAGPLAIVLGLVLFVFFTGAGFVLLVIVSARAGT
jgi:hypothetical protein